MSQCQYEIDNLDNKTISALNTPKFKYDEFPTSLWPASTFENSAEHRSRYQKIMNQCMNQRLQKEYKLSGYTEIEYCITNNDINPKLDGLQMSFLWIVMVIIVLVIISSIYDHYFKILNKSVDHFTVKPKNHFQLAMISFSINRNLSKLLSTTRPANDYRSLHGIRVLLNLLVILVHALAIFSMSPPINSYFIESMTFNFFYIMATKSFSMITSFFSITAFIFAFYAFDNLKDLNLKRIFGIILRRYVRYNCFI